MGVGLANDVSTTGRSLTQVATVWGAGLSVPIANRSLATETSINLHVWAEYEVSRALEDNPNAGDPLGFVFGPSISIGNIGAMTSERRRERRRQRAAIGCTIRISTGVGPSGIMSSLWAAPATDRSRASRAPTARGR